VVSGQWLVNKRGNQDSGIGLRDSGRKRQQQTEGTKKHKAKSPSIPLYKRGTQGDFIFLRQAVDSLFGVVAGDQGPVVRDPASERNETKGERKWRRIGFASRAKH
jgi:hypothetical protein